MKKRGNHSPYHPRYTQEEIDTILTAFDLCLNTKEQEEVLAQYNIKYSYVYNWRKARGWHKWKHLRKDKENV